MDAGNLGKSFQRRRGLGACALAALDWRVRLGSRGMAVVSDKTDRSKEFGPEKQEVRLGTTSPLATAH